MIFPNLPYKKTDRVAELDAPRVHKIREPKKQAAAVPARRCSLSPICALRKSGNCDALHCKDAADYTARQELQ